MKRYFILLAVVIVWSCNTDEIERNHKTIDSLRAVNSQLQSNLNQCASSARELQNRIAEYDHVAYSQSLTKYAFGVANYTRTYSSGEVKNINYTGTIYTIDDYTEDKKYMLLTQFHNQFVNASSYSEKVYLPGIDSINSIKAYVFDSYAQAYQALEAVPNKYFK